MIEIKVGEFIKQHIEKIIDMCKVDSNELEALQDIDRSNEYFGISGYSFLCRRNDISNDVRYWKKNYLLGTQEFRVCSQFGGSKKDSNGKTLSQRHGEKFLQYLKNKNLLLEKYKDKKIKFIVESDNSKHIDSSNYLEKTSYNMPSNYIIKTKNIILYGPPGVGKTYNHKKLISLIESGENQKYIFDSILNNDEDFDDSIFETIKSENRFKFVTFHQSYSYEDFIEGFRPNEDGSIKLEDGVFKELASEASKNLLNSNETNNILDFDNIVEQFQEENEIGSFLKTVQGKEFEILDYTPKSIHIKVNENRYSISYSPLNKILLENNEQPIQRPSDVIKVLDGFRGLATYYFSIFKEMLKYKTDEVQKIEQKNFYILIDEINRGNISKIFGELITLIEDDKRDEIEVTLPYSKEPFQVPSNLYIIATMNSTDKSIALIDVALRRRFTFLKMKPDVELIINERAKDIFVALNKIIEERIAEDYLIGHSYFMDEDLDLEFVLEYKIKPLLEEYFYADKEGLNEVMGIVDNFQ